MKNYKLSRCVLILICCFLYAGDIFGARLYTGSSSHINKIIQDKAGYIWLATDNGLSRYDGFHTKTYTRSTHPSLLSNMVLSILEDSRGDIWIGTNDGIQKFNRANESFETPRLTYPGVPEFSYVNSIIEDSKGNIWFTTSRSGLVCFQAKDKTPVCYMPTNSNICSDRTSVVYEDKFGNIWVGSEDNGLTMFNPSNKTMMNYRHDPKESSSLSGNMIYSIAQTNDGDLYVGSLDGGIDCYSYRTHKFSPVGEIGNCKPFVLANDSDSKFLFVGTDGSGILKYNLESGQFSTIDPDVRDFDIRQSKVHDILKDQQGNLWAAVYQRGALIIPPEDSGVKAFGFNPFNTGLNIGNDPVLSVLKDSRGRLWIGTDGDGIYVKEKEGNLRHIKGGSNPDIVMCLFEDDRGDIWAGAYLGGLYKYNSGSQGFSHFRLQGNEGLGTVNTINQDSEGRMWLGTNGNGVYIFDPATGVYSRMVCSREKPKDAQICSNTVHSICFDRNGKVWIGTSDAGMSMYNPDTGKFRQYNLANRSLNNNCVYSIVEDRAGNIWAATATGLVSISNGQPMILTGVDGIPEASVYGLLADNEGNLWFSNQQGINCYNLKEKRIVKYFSPQRMGVREFKRGAAFITSDGRIYFGGVGGVVSFLPNEVRPVAQLGNVRINSVLVPPGRGETNPMEMPVVESSKIKLDYRHNTFTVNFGAFEFIAPEDITYSVFLENYNDIWLVVPNGTQSASFSEIPPGDYVLRIKAVSGDSEAETSLPILITPPPYKTTMAKVGYGVGVILLLLIAFWIIRKNHINNLEHRRLLQEERIKEEKLQFFTDISHEVRTPLTLILSPISSLKKTVTDKKIINTFEMMESNGQRILRMIDQVIDLRKYDNDRMRLQLSNTPIREFLGNICNSFSNVLSAKKIEFTLSVSEEVPQTILIDRDKIDKVVFNVLANAARFTPKGGKIDVYVDIDGNNDLRIRISDTGPGIPEDLREAVFERFFQGHTGKQTGGTGIGLHLSRKMMESHFGNIFVEESDARGTTFAIIIPIDDERYKNAERVEEENEEALPVAVTMPVKTSSETGRYEISGLSKPHTILIIEDDASIIDYLTQQLSKQYNVLSATGGESGYEAVLRHRPHCVVTDVMLGDSDGLEICRRIRKNSETCDIPVIILTAKASEEQKIEGLEAGADSYIIKPFNIDHLRTQISTLIQSRRIMKEKFSNASLVNEEIVGMKTADEKLLNRLETVVVEEISNPELSVQFIADKIGVSRSHLHRKLKELINTNPVAYIKQARMKHARILLIEKGMSVSEVAFATGFNSLSHFSTVFKEFYGMSPTKFILVNPPDNKSGNN